MAKQVCVGGNSSSSGLKIRNSNVKEAFLAIEQACCGLETTQFWRAFANKSVMPVKPNRDDGSSNTLFHSKYATSLKRYGVPSL